MHRRRDAEAAEQVDRRETPLPIRLCERRLPKGLEQPGDGLFARAGKRPRRRLREESALRIERLGKDLQRPLADSRAPFTKREGGRDSYLEMFIAESLEQWPFGRLSNSSKNSCCRRALRDGRSAFGALPRRRRGQELRQLGHSGLTERSQRVRSALSSEVVSQTLEEQRDRAALAQASEGPGALAEKMGAQRFQQRLGKASIGRCAEVCRDAVDDGILGEPESCR